MGAAKPCLGFPSRTAAVIGLRTRGLRDSVIAHEIGIPVSTVSALAASASRRQASDAYPAVSLKPALRERLCWEAEHRGFTMTTLVNAILGAVIHDNLIDAVLDDDFRQELSS